MHVLVTGSSGLIGSALRERLSTQGDQVTRLVLGPAGGPGVASWDPRAGALHPAILDDVDAVVHLAGEGIGERRWSAEQKRRILDSRVQGTTLLANAVARAPRPPHVLVSASAVGYYGDRGDEELTEESSRGSGFLADVCNAWEQATAAAADAGVRVVTVRSGIVLARHGGALARMLLPFRLGLGSRVASGRQWMSWITLDDEIGTIMHALGHDDVSGPLNSVAPAPVTNAEFTHMLGRVLRRPTILPTPLLPLKLRYGSELVDQLLVAGQRVVPAKLVATGYEFAAPRLEHALRLVLDRPGPTTGGR